MRMLSPASFFLAATAVALAGCGEEATLPVAAGTGPNPQLPAPNETLIPTVNIAPAKGWPEGATPKAAAGLQVAAFADGLDHPRWLHVLPNGDVLVAETNAPPKAGGKQRDQGLGHGSADEPAGARRAQRQPHHPAARRRRRRRGREPLGLPRRTVLAVRHGAGRQATSTSPTPTRSCASPTRKARPRSPRPAPRSLTCPAARSTITGPRTSSPARTAASSTRPSARTAMSARTAWRTEEGRAAIWEIDPTTGQHRIFASGLRNPIGMAWEPTTGTLWTAVNERDEIGSDLVPDYMTSVQDGGFYGWPYSYYGQHVDERVEPQQPGSGGQGDRAGLRAGPAHRLARPDLLRPAARCPAVRRAAPSSASMARGTASRTAATRSSSCPSPMASRPAMPVDVLTGFLDGEGNALGRPVGVGRIDKAACWSPTMSATGSGGFRQRRMPAWRRSKKIAGVFSGLWPDPASTTIPFSSYPDLIRASPRGSHEALISV